MRLLLVFALPIALAGCFGEWNKDFDTMKRGDDNLSYESRPSAIVVREMDAKRKVADQDCSKPFDPSAGNVRCR